MLPTAATEKAKKYIETQVNRKALQDSSKDLTAGPCITLSRETGAGSNKVCELLIEFLRPHALIDVEWTVFDKNLIEKVLQDHHLPLNLSRLMAEEKYSAIKSIMNEVLGGKPSIWSLVHKTTETILQLAQIGNVILLDRGANFITSKLKNCFHVRLVAPFEDRVSHIQELYNYNRKDAVEFIKKEELDRKNYVTTYFQKDISDPLQYHMVLNMHLINQDEAAQIIGSSLIKKMPLFFKNLEEKKP